MRLLRKWKAKRIGVPFECKKFWPAWDMYRGEEREDGLRLVWQERNIFEPRLIFGPGSPQKGDVLPVWHSDGMAHYYRIVSVGRAGGSDHIIDPTHYDIEYMHSLHAKLEERAS